ncbi:nicotinamide riboside transporter PnuC [Chitinimonas koreensis]|uniref:nicotinamide riboside transporter PnuC n=1 Tax=Chitinimonas koreensis TaxID=356302 RepID=UPI00040C6558|nr:nicotinamide riboside transporter PnuC [Chitinimonas koreensis]QNM98008.1 nicotinamide mononucleotide transporter [Chitinimonas koreensis]
MTLLDQMLSMTGAEIAGFALTLAAIWLAARNRWQTWPLQIAAGLLYVWLFAAVNLYGEAALNGLYVLLAGYGLRAWLRRDAGRPALPIGRMSRREHAWLWGLGLAGTAVVAQLQVQFLPTDLPWLDSTVFVFGCLAQWLQARRRLENWPLWIVLDLLAAGIYAYKDLQVTALLYLVLAVLAGYGWLDWRREAKGRG